MTRDHKPKWVSGGCLCGAIRYEVDASGVFDAGYCHCSMCRRATGAPVLAWALVRREAFRCLGATPSRYQSSQDGARLFCPVCGGQLFYDQNIMPEMIGIHPATLDEPAPPSLRPRLHMFADDQLCWLQLRDDLPRFVDNNLSHPDSRR